MHTHHSSKRINIICPSIGVHFSVCNHFLFPPLRQPHSVLGDRGWVFCVCVCVIFTTLLSRSGEMWLPPRGETDCRSAVPPFFFCVHVFVFSNSQPYLDFLYKEWILDFFHAHLMVWIYVCVHGRSLLHIEAWSLHAFKMSGIRHQSEFRDMLVRTFHVLIKSCTYACRLWDFGADVDMCNCCQWTVGAEGGIN